MAGRGKGVHQVGAHLIAAWTNARAYDSDDIVRPRAELALQRVQSGNRSPRCRAAPARVHRRDGASCAIGHQQWDAVRRANRDRHVRRVRDQNVGFRPR